MEEPKASPPKGRAAQRTNHSKPGSSDNSTKKVYEFATREQMGAAILKDWLVPAVVAAMLPMPEISNAAAIHYMDEFLTSAGNSQDPIERMLLQQLILAHHRLISLHAEAKAAENLDRIKVLNNATACLLGEFRRMALSIRAYRVPPAPKAVHVVQNLATGASGHQMYVERSQLDEQEISSGSNRVPPGEGDEKGGIGGRFAGEERGSSEGGAAQRPQATALGA